jgi:uncharacterized OB-fold protein
MTTSERTDDGQATYDEYVAKGELRLQKCAQCGYIRNPVDWICPQCLGTEYAWEPLSGQGTVETFVWYLHDLTPHPAGLPATPYNVAVVTLAEGPRVVSNVTGVEPGALAVDMPVTAWFDTSDPDRALLRFAAR